LATVRADIPAQLVGSPPEVARREGLWYDWGFARLLLEEADSWPGAK